jgi:hypothetical protein
MTGCKADCLHRRLVRDYTAERQRQEIAAENQYRDRDGNEHAEPLITFKQWLTGHAIPAEVRAA